MHLHLSKGFLSIPTYSKVSGRSDLSATHAHPAVMSGRPLVRTNRLNAIEHQIADGTHVSGACEKIETEGETRRASGWALLKGKRRQADCIVIAYQTPDAEPVLFAISDSIELRWDIARHSWPNDYLWSGWTATFPASSVPPGAKLSFWAVDADEPRLYRLD